MYDTSIDKNEAKTVVRASNQPYLLILFAIHLAEGSMGKQIVVSVKGVTRNSWSLGDKLIYNSRNLCLCWKQI